MIGDVVGIWETQRLTLRTFEHLQMFALALGAAVIVGIFLGIILYRRPNIAHIVFNFLNAIETVPTLALLVLLIPLFGLGSSPTIAASILYAILPVARNTHTGLSYISKELLEVGRALGLSEREILFKVRVPLALPLIFGGIRIALVFTMGVVTLGGLIAAGGLGAPLQTGIHLYDKGIIIVTGIWVGLLALLLDGFSGVLEKRFEVKF